MVEEQRRPLAWVESPLQLLGAAEYAASLGRPIDVVFRLTGDQMPTTAQELLDRGALFASCEPYFGIPWGPLREHDDWVIGDGFSGQFRAAASAIRPKSVTFLDDGDMTVHLAEAILGNVPFSRPNVRERGMNKTLGSITRERMQRLAARGRLTVFTSFADTPSLVALAGRDVDVRPNSFAWLREHARPVALPSPRIVLGSAGPTDGLVEEDAYLGWLTEVAAEAPVSYLPHRRETRAVLDRVVLVPSVELVETGLPAELALAGTTQPLELVTMRSTAATTLRSVLAGTGSTLEVQALAEPTR